MGTRIIREKSNQYSPFPHEKEREHIYRLVYWDDGSVWDERQGGTPPRAMERGEEWVTEAIHQFKQLLAGKITKFAINFTDGNTFVGRLTRAHHRAPCAEGRYFITARLKGKKKLREGWVDFKPSPQAPDVVQHVTQRLAQGGQMVQHIEVKDCQTEKGGKKWSGVFFHPPH